MSNLNTDFIFGLGCGLVIMGIMALLLRELLLKDTLKTLASIQLHLKTIQVGIPKDCQYLSVDSIVEYLGVKYKSLGKIDPKNAPIDLIEEAVNIRAIEVRNIQESGRTDEVRKHALEALKESLRGE